MTLVSMKNRTIYLLVTLLALMIIIGFLYQQTLWNSQLELNQIQKIINDRSIFVDTFLIRLHFHDTNKVDTSVN